MLASNLLAARSQMAFTLGFHILLVPLGLCLPLFTLIANDQLATAIAACARSSTRPGRAAG